jgi:hypothetical protein
MKKLITLLASLFLFIGVYSQITIDNRPLNYNFITKIVNSDREGVSKYMEQQGFINNSTDIIDGIIIDGYLKKKNDIYKLIRVEHDEYGTTIGFIVGDKYYKSYINTLKQKGYKFVLSYDGGTIYKNDKYEFTTIIDLNEYPLVYTFIVKDYTIKEKYEERLVYIQDSLSIRDSLYNVYINDGDNYLNNKNYTQAKISYTKSLEYGDNKIPNKQLDYINKVETFLSVRNTKIYNKDYELYYSKIYENVYNILKTYKYSESFNFNIKVTTDTSGNSTYTIDSLDNETSTKIQNILINTNLPIEYKYEYSINYETTIPFELIVEVNEINVICYMFDDDFFKEVYGYNGSSNSLFYDMTVPEFEKKQEGEYTINIIKQKLKCNNSEKSIYDHKITNYAYERKVIREYRNKIRKYRNLKSGRTDIIKKEKRYAFFIGSLGVTSYGFYRLKEAWYNKYMNAANPTLMNKYYNNADLCNKIHLITAGLAISVFTIHYVPKVFRNNKTETIGYLSLNSNMSLSYNLKF